MSRLYTPIEDYAIIGDCRSAALVSREGSLDWLCWPRFDSPSLFAALLDPERGGRFSISAAEVVDVQRHYEPDSNVLVTDFSTSKGRLRLTDLFFAASEDYKRRHFLPQAMIIRRVECLEGEVTLDVEISPRPDFGRSRPRLRQAGTNAWTLGLNGGLVVFTGSLPLQPTGEGLAGRARFTQAEESLLVMAYSEQGPAVFPPLGEMDALIQETKVYWQRWAQRVIYDGPHRAAVVRSALALKLLTYAPSGAVVAAATTSLPERAGAAYNWDYRFCWLRDASYTMNALVRLGMHEEAYAFLQWLLHATRQTRPRLQIMYSVLGKPGLPEQELDHLSGYNGSRPVRTGNAAHSQLQLDVYGEVLNAARIFNQNAGTRLSRDERSFLKGCARYLLENWQRPDSGIWETREGLWDFVHSKAMAWLAADCAAEMSDAGLLDCDPARFREAAAEMIRVTRAMAFSDDLQSYTATFGGGDLDASILALPVVGFESAKTEKMASSIKVIRRSLAREELVYRHKRAETEGEGAFLLCSFWLVQCLALQGEIAEARRLFDLLCERSNDVGLYSEEIDPGSGAFLGNFPQAFTHIGLINAALELQAAESDGNQ
jgi:GH15 family glucan-1,4-alpha-glucosidase